MIKLRAPMTDEFAEIERLWIRSFVVVPLEDDSGEPFVRLGKFAVTSVAPHAWRWMHRRYVEHRLKHDHVLVADVDGGLAGFIAFSVPVEGRKAVTIQYLYVLPEGRKCGIGRKLYQAARTYGGDAPVRRTHTTRHWAEFVAAMT